MMGQTQHDGLDLGTCAHALVCPRSSTACRNTFKIQKICHCFTLRLQTASSSATCFWVYDTEFRFPCTGLCLSKGAAAAAVPGRQLPGMLQLWSPTKSTSGPQERRFKRSSSLICSGGVSCLKHLSPADLLKLIHLTICLHVLIHFMRPLQLHKSIFPPPRAAGPRATPQRGFVHLLAEKTFPHFPSSSALGQRMVLDTRFAAGGTCSCY